MKTAIVGLGYVGLPLSIQFARSGVTVLGLDADGEKVEMLNKGQSYIKHIDSAAILEMMKAGFEDEVIEFYVRGVSWLIARRIASGRVPLLGSRSSYSAVNVSSHGAQPFEPVLLFPL